MVMVVVVVEVALVEVMVVVRVEVVVDRVSGGALARAPARVSAASKDLPTPPKEWVTPIRVTLGCMGTCCRLAG